jgi:hypothetical protein
MRQGQQNRRGRGRNRGKGGHQNPLTRSFESNGPDVKIRGTPAHIAEKYISLARDAQSSGDPVLAENYLQHAEHYNRIIMGYREQQMQHSGEMVNGGMRPRSIDGFEAGEDFGEDDSDEFGGEPGSVQPPPGRVEGQPGGFEGQPREDRPQRGYEHGRRPPRHNDYRGFRGDRSDRERDRTGPDQRDRDRSDRQERSPDPASRDQPEVGGRPEGPRRRERFAEAHDQPEFLRRPVRRPRREGAGQETEPEEPAPKGPADNTPG